MTHLVMRARVLLRDPSGFWYMNKKMSDFLGIQKFKSICWIFPVKTKMQINLFDFKYLLKYKINFLYLFFLSKSKFYFEKYKE